MPSPMPNAGRDIRRIDVAPEGATTTIALVSAMENASSGVENGTRLRNGDADVHNAEPQSPGIDAERAR